MDVTFMQHSTPRDEIWQKRASDLERSAIAEDNNSPSHSDPQTITHRKYIFSHLSPTITTSNGINNNSWAVTYKNEQSYNSPSHIDSGYRTFTFINNMDRNCHYPVSRNSSAHSSSRKPNPQGDNKNLCCVGVKRRCHLSNAREFFERSSFHGIYDFYTASSRPVRCFWGISFAAALAMAAYGWFAIFRQFSSSPVVVSYMVHEADNKTLLPDVVVCPFGRFNQSYFNKHNVSDKLVEHVQTVFGLSNLYPFNQRGSNTSIDIDALEIELAAKLFEIGGPNFTFDHFIDAASFQCSDFIQYCVTYQGIKNCCETAQPVVTNVGRCYRLLGTEQQSSGFGFGLTILVKVPEDRDLSVGLNSLFNEGVSVKLVESGKGLDFDLTFIPSGTHALMPLRAVKYEFLPDPPRYKCLASGERGYSALRCFDNCFFNIGTKKCGCSQVTLASDGGMRTCLPTELYRCLLKEIRDEVRRKPDYIQYCREECMPPCHYWQYHPTVSFANFPSPALYHYVAPQDQHLWRKMIILDVFYEKLEFTRIKHFPSMTGDSFVSNLGGQLSLWIGGSVLSILQFLIFGCLLPFSRCFQRQWASRKSTTASNAQNASSRGDVAKANGTEVSFAPQADESMAARRWLEGPKWFEANCEPETNKERVLAEGRLDRQFEETLSPLSRNRGYNKSRYRSSRYGRYGSGREEEATSKKPLHRHSSR